MTAHWCKKLITVILIGLAWWWQKLSSQHRKERKWRSWWRYCQFDAALVDDYVVFRETHIDMYILFTGYIAGVFCAIVSHPADTIVSKLNNEKGSNFMQAAKSLGFAGKYHTQLLFWMGFSEYLNTKTIVPTVYHDDDIMIIYYHHHDIWLCNISYIYIIIYHQIPSSC